MELRRKKELEGDGPFPQHAAGEEFGAGDAGEESAIHGRSAQRAVDLDGEGGDGGFGNLVFGVVEKDVVVAGEIGFGILVDAAVQPDERLSRDRRRKVDRVGRFTAAPSLASGNPEPKLLMQRAKSREGRILEGLEPAQRPELLRPLGAISEPEVLERAGPHRVGCRRITVPPSFRGSGESAVSPG